MSCVIANFLQVPFKVLQTFNIPKSKSLMIVYRVMVMHNIGFPGKHWEDIILHQPVEIFVFMRRIKGYFFGAIKAHACSGRIDKNNSVIPVEQRGLTNPIFNIRNKS